MGLPEERAPVGAIFDTNSDGRFDLVVYVDGLLAVRGTYVGVALRGAGAAAAGAGVSAGAGTYEARRLARVLQSARTELATREPNFFIPLESIFSLSLRKRWYAHSLQVGTRENSDGRSFSWKPRLNDFGRVQEILASTFPDRFDA